MNKGFNQEVESWNSLYQENSTTAEGRYAIFQKNAQKRTLKRMDLCLSLLEPHPAMKILDLGCGNGIFSRDIVSKGAYWIGVDVSRNMLKHGRMLWTDSIVKRTAWVNSSGYVLPIKGSSCNAAICIGMINFSRNEMLPIFLNEMARILKSGGALIFTSLRLDFLTWLRSRLYPWIPLPISSPGPLYPMHYRKVLDVVAGSYFECVKMIHVKKYLGLPHYTMFKLIRK